MKYKMHSSNMQLLPNTCSWIILKSEIMHGKCRILRFKLSILIALSTSNPVPKNINNNWSMDGNVASENWNSDEHCVVCRHGILTLCIFPPTAYTQCFIFCLSNKLKKQDRKHLLVTDIISINTHFRVKNTYNYMTQTATHSKQNTNQKAIKGENLTY